MVTFFTSPIVSKEPLRDVRDVMPNNFEEYLGSIFEVYLRFIRNISRISI